MTYIISQIIGWIATIFRASGMLVKNAKTVKVLVSIGNLGWAISGILTNNAPLIASNVLCLCIMALELVNELVKERKK